MAFETPILVIPLDARPVCYQMVLELAQMAQLPVALPPKEMLGHLKNPAPFEQLWGWWHLALQKVPQAGVILAMDTMAYGGLISSRVNTESQAALEARIKVFLDELTPSNHPRYGFSSILRIPNYNNAEEEPDYWNDFGTLLHQFSVDTHQKGTMPGHLFNLIPGKVIKDFMDRRQKNFFLNQHMLTLLDTQELDLLIFAQDDTGQFGLNVKEASTLRNLIQQKKRQNVCHLQTGADEVASTLLARAVWAHSTQALKVYTWFFPEHGKKALAKFDGILLSNVVQRQLQTLGAVACLSPQDADLILMVNAPTEAMGDHCANQKSVRLAQHTDTLIDTLQEWLPKKPIALADVVYANGADSNTINTLLERQVPLGKLASYAAWNTPGNTIGSCLAMGSLMVWAQQNQMLDQATHQKMLYRRFLDDWAYQAEVRQQLKQQHQGVLPDIQHLQHAMAPYVEKLQRCFEPMPAVTFTWPCHRWFEIEIEGL